MKDLPSVKKVAILGHIGKGNLGDEASMAALIQNIRRRHPAAAIWGFTLNPADTQARHQIPAFPIRRLTHAGGVVTAVQAGSPPGDTASSNSPAGGIKQWVKKVPLLGPSLRA